MSVELLNSPILLKVSFGCVLIAIVARMAVIDSREQILPDGFNALLAVTGLTQAVLAAQPGLADAALGALFGFVVLRVVAGLFRWLRGIDGLGQGDQKFAAAAGLWIGWELMAPMLLVASCSALLFVAVKSMKERKFDAASRLPFGPFLGFGTVVCWLVTSATGS